VCDAVDDVLEHARAVPSGITALGVGVPGIVSHPGGVVSRCPNVGWEDAPLGRLLQERFRVPVVVENDVNLAALGEAWRGSAQGMTDFAVIAIGTGIGAGIVVGRELVHGRHHAAGEVGYLVPGAAYLSQPAGDQGCLEALAAGPGIAERAAGLLQSDPRPGPLGELDRIRAEDVFRLWRAGDALATTVIEELADHIALLTAAIAVILDPEIIIYGGSVGLAAEDLLPAIAARIEGRVPVVPALEVSRLEGQATLLGAISAALALARTVERGRAGTTASGYPAHSRRDADASVALAFRSIQTGG
jgi:predicted NBD/HSP70 family sugar kinase